MPAKVICIIEICHRYAGYDEAMVLHRRMETEIYDFSCPARGYCGKAVIFLAAGVSLVVFCFLLARDLGWQLGAYLRVDHQVLVV
jgi:hypothetical protein